MLGGAVEEDVSVKRWKWVIGVFSYGGSSSVIVVDFVRRLEVEERTSS